MVLLKNRTFCRKKVLEMALGSSTKSSHMARRLLEGVFKNDALIKSTLTGQAPKSLGKERQSQKYDCLDSQARKDITGMCFNKNIFAKPELNCVSYLKILFFRFCN